MAAPVLARAAAALLTNEDGRKAIGWVLALLLSPLIILAAFLCCFGDGASQHNNAVVSAAFYGAELSSQIPAEYRAHITEMQEAFSLLDSATVYVNQKAEEGGLDPVQVKAIFFALCFGDNAPTRSAADRFVDCFYKTETRTRMVTVTQEDGTEELVEETYEVAVPLSVEDVYEKLTTWRGRVVTDAERSNAVDIYAIVMGSMGGDTFNGAYEPGGSAPIELDASMLTDPTTKNAADLVTYVANAWNSGWGYVWGTYGQVLTPELLQYKLTQYPDGVGKYADFIRANWLGRHTAETVVLLSKLNTKQHIEVELNLDELDLTSAESKATYEEIKEYVLEHTGLKVSHLYIAQVKQKYGIIERENYNKPKSENAKQPKCPPEKEAAITEALKFFGMI